MITYNKANKLLPPGDVVFALDNYNEVRKVTVEKVLANCIRTDFGFLDFEDHGYTWWLTEQAAIKTTID